MFQTKVEILPTSFNINYEDKIMTLGSCFAENIGHKMKAVYFETEVNPFGVLYNPVSISNSINQLLEKRTFTEIDLFPHRGLWQNFSYSSLFSDITAEKYLQKINEKRFNATEFLLYADVLLITFGTAWVYEDRKSGEVISNCHKLPANHFNRRRLAVDEIVEIYSILIEKLTELIPNIQLVFSVSPIRHWKDGAHENNLSKSILLLSIDALQKQFKQVHYFPAYEIQMDELRDYRFYASDMLHPSEVAINYIWKRFSEIYFDETTIRIKMEFEQLVADINHRPLFPDSVEYSDFKKNIMKKKKELISKYPFLSTRLK